MNEWINECYCSANKEPGAQEIKHFPHSHTDAQEQEEEDQCPSYCLIPLLQHMGILVQEVRRQADPGKCSAPLRGLWGSKWFSFLCWECCLAFHSVDTCTGATKAMAGKHPGPLAKLRTEAPDLVTVSAFFLRATGHSKNNNKASPLKNAL